MTHLKRPSTRQVESLLVPQISLVSISDPQHMTTARRSDPEVHCQTEHMRSKHVVMETENTVLLRRGRVRSTLVGGLEDSTQEHSRVLKLLWGRWLYVEVVARAGALCVVFPGPCVKGRSRALDAGPVKHITSVLLLFPVAQSMFKVTLQLWSCKTWQKM